MKEPTKINLALVLASLAVVLAIFATLSGIVSGRYAIESTYTQRGSSSQKKLLRVDKWTGEAREVTVMQERQNDPIAALTAKTSPQSLRPAARGDWSSTGFYAFVAVATLAIGYFVGCLVWAVYRMAGAKKRRSTAMHIAEG